METIFKVRSIRPRGPLRCWNNTSLSGDVKTVCLGIQVNRQTVLTFPDRVLNTLYYSTYTIPGTSNFLVRRNNVGISGLSLPTKTKKPSSDGNWRGGDERQRKKKF